MSGILLLIPFLLIRFGVLSLLEKDALKRAAFFAPLEKKEKAAYWLYQLSNIAIFVYLFFLKILTAPAWLFVAGSIVYGFGTLLCIASMAHFSAPSDTGMNENGLYRHSRNPMYMAYYVFFMGCALLTQSLGLLAFVIVFMVSGHWIVLSEERWCIQKFGHKYLQYMEIVRRYL